MSNEDGELHFTYYYLNFLFRFMSSVHARHFILVLS